MCNLSLKNEETKRGILRWNNREWYNRGSTVVTNYNFYLIQILTNSISTVSAGNVLLVSFIFIDLAFFTLEKMLANRPVKI